MQLEFKDDNYSKSVCWLQERHLEQQGSVMVTNITYEPYMKKLFTLREAAYNQKKFHIASYKFFKKTESEWRTPVYGCPEISFNLHRAYILKYLALPSVLDYISKSLHFDIFEAKLWKYLPTQNIYT